MFENQQKASNVLSSLPKKIPRREFFEVKKVDPSKLKNDIGPLKTKTLLKSISNDLDRIIDQKDYYSKELSKIDKEIEDLKHFGEFNCLSASDGYKWYKVFHEKLLVRREIKNAIKEIDLVKSAKQKINSLNSEIIKLDRQKYSPRYLKELFKTCNLESAGDTD